jgi:hypothetical protein
MNAQRIRLAPLCPYCGTHSELVNGTHIYPHRADLAHMAFYACDHCSAWVGCHAGSGLPLGRLANAELRALKRRVHKLLDPLWINYWQAYPETFDRTNKMRRAHRARCYLWLAQQLQIRDTECHVGMFDEERCRLAIGIITNRKPTPLQIRQWYKSDPEGALCNAS